jgi:hypothetical protein
LLNRKGAYVCGIKEGQMAHQKLWLPDKNFTA